MKLRKLILLGFKSFCDRTEFVFDDGITCVVGPNGCGKSNVVDAVKWVLGEQSAKSLRGSEMLDVIFNGSSARRASGLCEVTLEFDNDDGTLQPIVAAASQQKPHVVSVTRRLYRSGESEYLINGKVIRLKDVREMFMDTGIGTNAYSFVEQGRVAELLQANPIDRRAIFEEAAGISKYKARKREALRKLERVEQNLLRVNDILAEVQKRLRSIKYQAGKARNYQTYTEQLKSLRALFSLAQYHTLRHDRVSLQERADQFTDRVTASTTRIDQLEANHTSIEAEMAELEIQARQTDGEIATVSGQITTCAERVDMLAARCRELAEEIRTASVRRAELDKSIESSETTVRERDEELATVELRIRQCAEQVEAILEDQHAGQMALTKLRAELEDEKAGTIDLLRRTSQLHNDITAFGVRRESLTGQKQRLASRAEEMAKQIADIIADRARVEVRLTEVAAVIAEAAERLETAKAEGLTVAAHQHELDEQIGQGKELRSSLQSRRNTLEEMQQRGEGLAEGVRRVLAAREAGKLSFVRGLLAEFVKTELTHASIVETALAATEQCLVIERLDDLLTGRAELEEALESAGAEIVCLDQVGPAPEGLDLAALPVQTERLVDLVEFDNAVAPALSQMLGRTLIVDDIPAARAAAEMAGPDYRFVTRDGAVLEGNGRIRMGQAAAGGIISRQSEMEDLARQLKDLNEQIETLTSQRQAAVEQREHLDDIQQQLRTAVYEGNTERVNHESKRNRLCEQLAQLERERPIITTDIEAIGQEIEDAARAEHAARESVTELETRSAERQAHIDQLNEQVATCQQKQDHLQTEMTDHRVRHATALEHKTRVAEAQTALRRAIDRMGRQRQEMLAQARTADERVKAAEDGIKTAKETTEQLYEKKVELDQLAADVHQSRKGLTERIEEIRAARTDQRRIHEQAVADANKLRVEVGEADVRIESLITRVADEIGMDLVNEYPDYEHDAERDWDAVESEILELRGKIQRLGNVNLDAIAEQEELEQRDEFLASQVADIDDSKNQLTGLIEKINTESLTLFSETFDAIAESFRSIFRKLFGGGKADILLTDPEDVLESGVEIIARPPGKELRSITLLSGGEKTMATVALLFSIFRSRPSPFCILDEVDAALDEANNERFNAIVQEFLDQSQFILITHSKRSMAIGNVLYGVTMQEPGVSRRVSVKFEEAAELVEDEPEAATVKS